MSPAELLHTNHPYSIDSLVPPTMRPGPASPRSPITSPASPGGSVPMALWCQDWSQLAWNSWRLSSSTIPHSDFLQSKLVSIITSKATALAPQPEPKMVDYAIEGKNNQKKSEVIPLSLTPFNEDFCDIHLRYAISLDKLCLEMTNAIPSQLCLCRSISIKDIKFT